MNCHFSLLFRCQTSFQQLRIHGSKRSAFVIQALNGCAVLMVNQPSDCLAFQRNLTGPGEVQTITVWVGHKFTSQINGLAEPETPEVWQTALHHLLNTYKPRFCFFHTGGKETGLVEEVRVQAGANNVYIGFWNEKQHTLCLIR